MAYFGFSYFTENQSRLNAIQVTNPKTSQCVAPSKASVFNSYRPLARPLFIYAKGSSFKRQEVQAFLDYIFDNEVAIANRSDFISLTPKQLQREDELPTRGEGFEPNLAPPSRFPRTRGGSPAASRFSELLTKAPAWTDNSSSGTKGGGGVLLLRHASAGARLSSPHIDRFRELDDDGRVDARQLIWTLAGRALVRVVTSPLPRCVQSVVPIAESRGLVVERRDELLPDATVEEVMALLVELPDASLVCTHRRGPPALRGRDFVREGRCLGSRAGRRALEPARVHRPAEHGSRSVSARGFGALSCPATKWNELADECADSLVDLVSDAAHRLEILAGRVVELPVLVALPRVDRTGIAAAHRDHDVRGSHDLVRERLRVLLAHVDAELGHGLDDCGIQILCG